jgi:plasmid stability protein
MVETGLQEGIPVSAAGLEKLSGLVDDLNQQISGKIQAAGPKRQISPGQAVQNTRDLESRFQNQVNPTADLDAISTSREDFLNQLRPQGVPGGAIRNLTAEQAQAMKQGTYAQLKTRAYGELKSATVEAQKALARGLKEELAAQFPEIDALNAREGQLLQLEPAIEKAVQRIANHQLIGIGTPIAGGAVGMVTGSRPLAAVTGMMKAVLDNPVVKSRLAIRISKGSGGRIPLPMAQARVVGYLNALGQGENAATDQPLSGQANQ